MTEENAPISPGSDAAHGYLGYIPDAAAVSAAKDARRELEALGAEAEYRGKWWGFELHLNQLAVDTVSALREVIVRAVSEFLPSALAELIGLIAVAQDLWIKEVSKGHGCKLVSPWISPTMLIPVPLDPVDDTSLYWTVFMPGDGWNDDQKFTAHHSGSNPALAEFNGKLYLVHRGFDSPNDHLWWAVYDPDTGWSEDQRIHHYMTYSGPALAAFNGKLHCVYRGVGDDKCLYHITFDGTRWSAETRLSEHMSSSGPALAVFNGHLHLVHKSGNNNELWHATYDGATWSRDTRLPKHMTSANPALAVFNGRLHLVHKSGNNSELWHATYDGSQWSDDTRLPKHESLEGPGLAVFDNKLYCIHRGYGGNDQDLWWTSYNNSSWSPDQRVATHKSGAGPAVIVYRDKNGDRNQLLVVHRGTVANRAAGTDTAEMEALIAEEERAIRESTA